MRAYTTLFLLLMIPFIGKSQHYLSNGSFEGLKPQDATMPIGWLPCKLGTTPDILPGPWGVIKEPSEGETYLGLITRADNSWESITQRLEQPLQANKCYRLKLDLAYSIRYPMHNKPIKLRVYGSQEKCADPVLLIETDLIDHVDWEAYDFLFRTEAVFNFLIFEACFPDGEPIGGNILIDNIQPIKECGRA